jgi:hypothetical protein
MSSVATMGLAIVGVMAPTMTARFRTSGNLKPLAFAPRHFVIADWWFATSSLLPSGIFAEVSVVRS